MKILSTILFLFFTTFIYGQSNHPRLTVIDFEHLINLNMEERESYLDKYEFVYSGIVTVEAIKMHKYLYSDMRLQMGQTLVYYNDKEKKGIGYIFYDSEIYKNFKNSLLDNYEYLGDELSLENGGLSYKNKMKNFFVTLKIEKVDTIDGSEDNMYIISFKNF